MKDQENNNSCPVTPLPQEIGPYKILKKIATGGMGEVFIAQDPFCKRTVALKKIRSDRMHVTGFKERFLKEVKIAAQLSHPGIIPIYQIHQTQEEIYYTMPLVEGETLKEILRTTLHQEKQGLTQHPIGSSIPALMRIFLNICQAIAYSHAKGILHRDLKPENIIIGKYGEVLILDWGLAEFAQNCRDEPPLEEEILDKTPIELTRPGKIAGTLSYLPPERILGKKASYSSDIYALGVILYQLLTLRLPFMHKTVKQYRKHIKNGSLIDPAERAPYRDIPSQLSKIAKKCLAGQFEKRYQSIQEVLQDLNNYIDGKAEWSPCGGMQIEHKSDWEFQENILLSKPLSLTSNTQSMPWINLMMAKQTFPRHVKFETHVHMKEEGSGIGFLLAMHGSKEKKEFFQGGIFVWIGSHHHPGCALFKSNVEILSHPDCHLESHRSHFLTIEKTDNHVKFYVDHILVFDYLSHIPLNIPHFGVVLQDNEIDVGAILVSSRSPNIMVNCLAVPDAFFAERQFKEALYEYRQIARSFLGRAEGREAVFRAGITLLEEAQTKKKRQEKEDLFSEALEEFGKLQNTPSAPLEYLGKSLVYKVLQEPEEERKCLELSLLKFTKHPLIHLIKDQILFRLHEVSYKDRKAAYGLALLALMHIPQAFDKPDTQDVLYAIKKTCEPLLFFQEIKASITCRLAFYLRKTFVLEEQIEKASSLEEVFPPFLSLMHLGLPHKVQEVLQKYPENPCLLAISCFYEKGLIMCLGTYFSSVSSFSFPFMKETLILLTDPFQGGKEKDKRKAIGIFEKMIELPLGNKDLLLVKEILITWLIAFEDFERASHHLEELAAKNLIQELSPLYFLQGCLLAHQKGFEAGQKHLSRQLQHLSFSTSYLIDSYLAEKDEKKKEWEEKLFSWEKQYLYKQLVLFYTAASMPQKAHVFHKKLKHEISFQKTF